jgi:hypothetical protein
MANVSRVNGFRPVKHLNGSPYNGQANIYEVPAGEAIPVFIGDLVMLSDSAATAGYPAVESVSTATTAVTGNAAVAVVGAVVGIFNTKVDVDGKMTTGSVSLDIPIYRPASTKQFVLVADAPDLVFEAEAAASVALTDVGMNADISSAAQTAGGGNGTSGQGVSTTAPGTVATRPLQIVGISKRVDNESASAYNKVLVRINTHQYGAAGLAGL